jgi:subtilisin family serine protease
MVYMVIVRNKLSSLTSAGPRQFSEVRDRFIVEVQDVEAVQEVSSGLDSLKLQPDNLTNFPFLIVQPRESIVEVLDALDRAREGRAIRESIKTVENAEVDDILDATENIVRATGALRDEIGGLNLVDKVDFVSSYVDYGPEQLGVSPFDLPDVTPQELDNSNSTQQDIMDLFGMESVWSVNDGSNSIVAIFDTGYSRDLIDQSRIVGTFSGDGVGGVYAPAEGHGTMTSGAAVANSDNDVPFDGVAKGSDVILVRITDENGQIRSDIISKAWDWLTSFNSGDRPIIANHSYGTPICSSRPRSKMCESATADLVRLANSDSDITSVYAAGNEARWCGHRLSGITNGITGLNSISEVITVGALRADMIDAQLYSSHGRGDCAPISNPKPDVSAAIPSNLYYGAEDGWKIKDMSSNFGGSSGGTSTAAPYVAGKIAILQSHAVEKRGEPMQTEEIMQIIEKAAEPPRRTQVNIIPGITPQGWDARFGYGQINMMDALSEI